MCPLGFILSPRAFLLSQGTLPDATGTVPGRSRKLPGQSRDAPWHKMRTYVHMGIYENYIQCIGTNQSVFAISPRRNAQFRHKTFKNSKDFWVWMCSMVFGGSAKFAPTGLHFRPKGPQVREFTRVCVLSPLGLIFSPLGLILGSRA